MDRSCPKRKKTKKIQSDVDVTKYLNDQDDNTVEKMVNMPKIPEEWEVGLVLSLYHHGFTVCMPPNTKLPTAVISYIESNFIRNIEEGLIPDQLIPILGDLHMLADSKLLVTVTDYRGFPRPGSREPYVLDFPITSRHILQRSVQSKVLELYDTLGEQLSLDQLNQLENYLLMLNSPPLCLDTSTQVFEVNSDTHESQHFLNHAITRQLITKLCRSLVDISTPCDMISELGLVLRHGNRDNPDFLKSKDASVDGKLEKLKISPDTKAPSFLTEILDLCTKRARTLSVQKVAQSTDQTTSSAQPEPSPGPNSTAPYPSPSLPHLKPAPFVSSTKPGVMPPISPASLPPNVLPNTSPMTPGGSVHSPHMVVPAHSAPPKNVATVNRIAAEPSKVSPSYNAGYVLPPQISPAPRQPPQVQRVAVPMMQMPQTGIIQQGGMMRAPGGQIMHVPQQMRPTNGTGHIDPAMNKPIPNAGMMMSQQYPRAYQYTNVQPMARSYVDAAQYIPVQQQPRPVQLQISLPPNMNPLQTRPRQPAPSIAPQPAMHNMPYNQMPVGQMQSPNIQNPNLPNQNMFNQFR